METKEVVIIGLGDCAISHVQALEQFKKYGYTISAGVDVDRSKRDFFHGSAIPVYQDVITAARRHPETAIVIISTPTPTHYDIFSQVCTAFAGRIPQILIEKPSADTYEDVVDMFHKDLQEGLLTPLLHFAYSPEVLWAQNRLPYWIKQSGSICNYQAFFADPRKDPEQAQKRAVLGSSWKDTGINALSVAYRFFDISGLTLHPALEPFDYEATIAFQSNGRKGTGSITTQWNSTLSMYISSFQFEDGSRLTLDHYSVRGAFDTNGQTTDTFSGDASQRRLSHYKNLYEDLFITRKQIIPNEDMLKLHKLLLADTKKQ